MFSPLFALHGGGQGQHFLTMQKFLTLFSNVKTAQPGSSVNVRSGSKEPLHGGYGAASNDKGSQGKQAGMKILTSRRLGLTLTTLALATTPAEAVNFAVSTQNFETIVELTSLPLPTIPAASAGDVAQISGRVICDEGSIILRLCGDAEMPGLSVVFHAGAVSLAPDGVMPLDVASMPGRISTTMPVTPSPTSRRLMPISGTIMCNQPACSPTRARENGKTMISAPTSPSPSSGA